MIGKMSTTVYKPLGLAFSGRTQEAMLFCRPEIRKVKRVLFEPADHVATQKFIEEELEKITVMESEKWNFDFRREKTLNPDGNYKWRPVTPQKTIRPVKVRPAEGEEDIQEMYGEPTELIRPTPGRVVDAEMKSPPKTPHKIQNENQKSQCLITDFMTVKKRSTSEMTKNPGGERPSKLPRLTNHTS